MRAVAQLPDPTWLVRRLLPGFGFTLLVGPPGVGKSLLALDLALSLVYAVPFLGRDTQVGSVVYVAAEGLYTMKARQRAWLAAHELDPKPGLHYLGEAVQLHQFSYVQKFIKTIEPVQPALVIIDTQARCSVGCNENSTEDMGRIVDGIDDITRSLNAAVLMLHHTQKLSAEFADRDDLLRERGNSAVPAGAEAEWRLTGTRSDLTLACLKMRSAREFSPMKLRIRTAGDRDDSAVIWYKGRE